MTTYFVYQHNSLSACIVTVTQWLIISCPLVVDKTTSSDEWSNNFLSGFCVQAVNQEIRVRYYDLRKVFVDEVCHEDFSQIEMTPEYTDLPTDTHKAR